MVLENNRLLLRPWSESDATECCRYAQNPKLGRFTGWPPHTSVDDSMRIIRDTLMRPETYAIVLKETGLPIGCIGLLLGDKRRLTDKPDECEIGYWLGEPFWGQGITPEAANLLLLHAFIDLGMKKIWSAYYDGNIQSKRVLEKCGFHYERTIDEIDVPSLHEKQKAHVNCLARDEWIEHIKKNAVTDEVTPDPNNVFPIQNY